MDKLLGEVTAIPADCLAILPETAPTRIRHLRQLLLLHEADMGEGIVDEEASKDAVDSTSQLIELRYASSVVGQTTMRGIVKLRL